MLLKTKMYNFPIIYKTKKTMKILRRFPQLGSSQDPQKISFRVKSMALMLVPAIIAIGQLFQFDLVENDLIQLINSVFFIVSYSGTIYGQFRV